MRIYSRDGTVKGFTADPLSKTPTSRDAGEDYQRLLHMEKDCLQKLRDMEQEANEILDRREEEEQNIELKYSFYDAGKNSVSPINVIAHVP
jgi:hypothetical protein